MTNKQWFNQWDKFHLEFQWFFIQYGFLEEWEELLRCRDKEYKGQMLNLMNKIWFILPDSKFNVRVNPSGWSHFLYLLENE
jgi:hypothetical protein